MKKRRYANNEKSAKWVIKLYPKLAKATEIAGYIGALVFIGGGIYYLTIPGGAIIGVPFIIIGGIIGIETYRVIKKVKENELPRLQVD